MEIWMPAAFCSEDHVSHDPETDIKVLFGGSTEEATASLQRLVALWSQAPSQAQGCLGSEFTAALKACIQNAVKSESQTTTKLVTAVQQALCVLHALAQNGDAVSFEPGSSEVVSIPVFDNPQCSGDPVSQHTVDGTDSVFHSRMQDLVQSNTTSQVAVPIGDNRWMPMFQPNKAAADDTKLERSNSSSTVLNCLGSTQSIQAAQAEAAETIVPQAAADSSAVEEPTPPREANASENSGKVFAHHTRLLRRVPVRRLMDFQEGDTVEILSGPDADAFTGIIVSRLDAQRTTDDHFLVHVCDQGDVCEDEGDEEDEGTPEPIRVARYTNHVTLFLG